MMMGSCLTFICCATKCAVCVCCDFWMRTEAFHSRQGIDRHILGRQSAGLVSEPVGLVSAEALHIAV